MKTTDFISDHTPVTRLDGMPYDGAPPEWPDPDEVSLSLTEEAFITKMDVALMRDHGVRVLCWNCAQVIGAVTYGNVAWSNRDKDRNVESVRQWYLSLRRSNASKANYPTQPHHTDPDLSITRERGPSDVLDDLRCIDCGKQQQPMKMLGYYQRAWATILEHNETNERFTKGPYVKTPSGRTPEGRWVDGGRTVVDITWADYYDFGPEDRPSFRLTRP